MKFCGENSPSGEFREIRENSRRENFPRNFPRNFCAFSVNRSVNVCEKVVSGKFRENFPRIFSEISGKNVAKKVFFRNLPTNFPPRFSLGKL